MLTEYVHETYILAFFGPIITIIAESFQVTFSGGHLPSEHLHVSATCTTGHLPYWATFNCAIKIRNHHIIRGVCGAIRTYSIDIMSTSGVDERVTAFANYMAMYICRGWHPVSTPSMASEPDADEDYVPCTTNAAESFHAHTKQLFNIPRPNLYLFAFKLRQLQCM